MPRAKEEPARATRRRTSAASRGPRPGAAAKARAKSARVSATRPCTGSAARSRASSRRARAIVTALCQARRRAREQPRQGGSAVEHLLHPVERRVQHRAPPRRVRRVEEGRLAARQLHPGDGQVDAVQRLAVRHQILQVVQHLQRRAEPVRRGERLRVPAIAVQPQQHPPDRIGGAAAVVLQRRPVGVAPLRRVLLEGGEHQPRLRRAHRQRVQPPRLRHGWSPGRPAPAPWRRAARAWRRAEVRAVADVVGGADEAVEGHHLRALRRRQQERGGREVLLVVVPRRGVGNGDAGAAAHAAFVPG